MPAETLTGLARVLRVTPETFEEVVEAAADVLLRGGVIALPTDTLYGVSALIEHSDKLYAMKKRPKDKPLGLFLADPTEISLWARLTISPHLAHQLLPGPVTLILSRLPSLPRSFNPGTENVGIRVPDSALVRTLCTRLGRPLAQTSANVSGSPVNPTCVDDFCDIMDQIDLVLDGGVISKIFNEPVSTSSEGSTIVDLSRDDFYRIIREGCALKHTEEILRTAGIRPL